MGLIGIFCFCKFGRQDKWHSSPLGSIKDTRHM